MKDVKMVSVLVATMIYLVMIIMLVLPMIVVLPVNVLVLHPHVQKILILAYVTYVIQLMDALLNLLLMIPYADLIMIPVPKVILFVVLVYVFLLQESLALQSIQDAHKSVSMVHVEHKKASVMIITLVPNKIVADLMVNVLELF